MSASHGRFVWYALATTDVEAAKDFYTKVLGWGARDASVPGRAYTLFTDGEASMSGLMELSPEARRTGVQPSWIGYVGVDDVIAAVDRIRRLGGTVHVAPQEIPNLSRFAVVADPQSATLALLEGLDPGAWRADALDKPRRVGWHELIAADWEKAFVYYGELFGWRKEHAEVGDAGTYQRFSVAGQTIGGMFTKSAQVRFPYWLYYFNVDDVDAAVARVKAAGGEVVEGPLEVSGDRIARCTDPQGAVFALEGKGNRTPIGYFESAAPRDPVDPRGRRWSW